MTHHPRIIIMGPPASGKTTIRNSIRSQLAAKWGSYLDCGIDETLRSMYHAGQLGKNGALLPDGSLQLISTANVLPNAMRLLLREYVTHDGPALVEVPLYEQWFSDLLRADIDLHNFCILYLKAAEDLRHARNNDRGRARISQQGMRSMPAQLPATILATLVDSSRSFLAVVTDENQSATLRACTDFVEAYLNRSDS